MRGEDERSGALFSYVDLEARVGTDHPIRPIRSVVNEALATLSGEFSALYSRSGRPSIPPEKLLRAMLLQAFYSIRSERQSIERLEFDLLFRWFVGIGVDDAAWDHSTFSKNRERLLEGDIAAKLLDRFRHPPAKVQKNRLCREQFRVPAAVLKAALRQHIDAIAVSYERRPMADDDYRLLASQFADSLDDRSFSPRIQIRRCLVDHQDRRVAVKRPGDHQSLTLAAREPIATLADTRIQSPRHRANEMIDLRRAQRLPYSLVIDLFLRHAEGDIAPNTVVDQVDGLRHVSDISLPARKVVVQIASIDQDPARTRRQKSEDKIGKCGLAGAARAYQAYPMPLRNFE
jgi:transposase